MKKIILFISLCIINLPASALDYNDFPADLQKVLNEKIADLNTSTGIFVAGRITTSDSTQIQGGEDVMVNLYDLEGRPLRVYEGGWFMMERCFPRPDPVMRSKLFFRAFGYEPNEMSLRILKGNVTYIDCVMQKITEENSSAISGIVVDDQNNPYEGATVHLSFPATSFGFLGGTGYPYKYIFTGKDGQYSFTGLSSNKYSITAWASGLAPEHLEFTPPRSETVTHDFVLYRNLTVVIEYVYQADGSNSFIGGNLKTGTIEWIASNKGLDFSEGKVKDYEPNSLRDIEMRQIRDKLIFRVFYVNGQNGFFDAGEVDFKSITEADLTGYFTTEKPVVVGHTYLVRTYENKYAKFAVKSISGDK
jgi:hypothetical protein